MGQFVRANSRPGRRGLFEGGEMTNEDWAAAEAYGASLPDPSWSPGGGAGSTTEWGPNMGGGTYPQPARRTVFPDARSGNNPTINPFGGIGRFIGRGIRVVGNKLQGLRGWNDDGTPKTQAQWEEEREQRIAQKRINNILGRDAPATKATNINLDRLYDTLKTPKAGRNLFTEGEINERVSPAMRQIYQTPKYELMDGQGLEGTTVANKTTSLRGNEGINKAEPGLTMMEEFYNKPIQKRISDATGYNQGDIELTGLNQSQVDYLNKIDKLNKAVGNTGYSTYAKSERYPDQMAGAFFEHQKPEDVWTEIESLNPKSTNLFSSAVNPEKIVEGDVTTFAQPDEVTKYIQSLSPQDKTYSHGLRKNVPGVDYTKKTWAQGGRVGYNTGGRVGILAAF